MTIQSVSEFPATAPEQIDHFAKLLSKSVHRRKVFWEIYRGKSKDAKTADKISIKVHLSAKRVLEIATPLAANSLFEKTKHDGRTAYRKYPNINTVKHKIKRLAENKSKLDSHVTVRKPRISLREIPLRIDRTMADVFVDVKSITVDAIDNFANVRNLSSSKIPDSLEPKRLPEKVFKNGIACILGNKGTFTDWGGEKNDLYTSHLRIKGIRYS